MVLKWKWTIFCEIRTFCDTSQLDCSPMKKFVIFKISMKKTRIYLHFWTNRTSRLMNRFQSFLDRWKATFTLRLSNSKICMSHVDMHTRMLHASWNCCVQFYFHDHFGCHLSMNPWWACMAAHRLAQLATVLNELQTKFQLHPTSRKK